MPVVCGDLNARSRSTAGLSRDAQLTARCGRLRTLSSASEIETPAVSRERLLGSGCIHSTGKGELRSANPETPAEMCWLHASSCVRSVVSDIYSVLFVLLRAPQSQKSGGVRRAAPVLATHIRPQPGYQRVASEIMEM